MLQKIETKVYTAGAGAGGGAALSGFILWLLGVLVWHAPNSADGAAAAVARVPSPVSLLIAFVLGIAGALLGGYAGPHTDRPDLIDQSGTPATASNVPVITGANSPAIPAGATLVPLANGGIIAGSGLATIGDGTPETVVPLSSDGPRSTYYQSMAAPAADPTPTNGNNGVVPADYDWSATPPANS